MGFERPEFNAGAEAGPFALTNIADRRPAHFFTGGALSEPARRAISHCTPLTKRRPMMTPKKIRGAACTLAQFAARYGMSEDEAAPIFEKFGPSSVDLDILMRAKGRQPVSAMAD